MEEEVNPEEMTPLEQKEIRGLSGKTLIALLICTITIVSSVVGTYFSLQGDIRELRLQREGEEKYADLRIRTIEVKMAAIELQYKELSSKYDELILNSKNATR